MILGQPSFSVVDFFLETALPACSRAARSQQLSLYASRIFLTSPSKSSTTLHGVLKVIVARLSESYAGQ
jgi:hypothetical protein